MKPIIFSYDNIPGILEGRKTQTRRAIKPQPWGYDPFFVPETGLWEFCDDQETDPKHHIFKCPYGIPGDQLWVRESWAQLSVRYVSVGDPEDGDSDAEIEEMDCIPSQEPLMGKTLYKADDPYAARWWFPSIFMPRWASRITLDVVKIRIQRLQDITREDCIAEGITDQIAYQAVRTPRRDRLYAHAAAYADLWDSLNLKRGFGWDENPMVWVVEFKPSKIKVAL